jgi:signal transduction histidine kinase
VEAAVSADLLDTLLADDHPIAALRVRGCTIAQLNAAASALFGARAAPGDDAPALFVGESGDKLRHALAAEHPRLVELQIARADGDIEALQLLVVPLDGDRLLLFAPDHDPDRMGRELMAANNQLANAMRELSRHASVLERARARLEELGALRDQFIATLAHDIKSPLSAIALEAQTLERGAPDPERALRAQRMQRSVKRILALIGSVLDAARLDAGQLHVEPRRVALPEVVAEVADSWQPLAEQANVRIETPSSNRGNVLCDPNQLAQLVGNLVDNAVRHSPAGGAVQIEVEERDAVVRCAVRDQGPGVPPDERSHLFDRFRQGKHPGSLGLGLYVARQLVELFGGHIFVEPSSPPGTTFVFELPRAP